MAVLAWGCSSYVPVTLPVRGDLADTLPHVMIDRAELNLPHLVAKPFDPTQPMDLDAVATFAVLNNPELRVARADAQVAHAQAFADGLLPDPTLGLAHDITPTGAFSAGISSEFIALVLHEEVVRAARGERQAADLNLLWQEWQTVAAAKLAAIHVRISDETVALLEERVGITEAQQNDAQAALQNGLATSAVLAPLFALRADAQRALDDARRDQHQAHHDLNLLLGLTGSVSVPLAAAEPPAPVDLSRVAADLDRLTERRPDLLALVQGFEAEDARYRANLIAQFPLLNFNVTRSKDNTGIYSSSLGITLTLPLFNGNRGAIAIEEATRLRLRDDYQDRIDATLAEVDRLAADEHSDQVALASANAALIRLDSALHAGERAYGRREVDSFVLSSLQTEVASRRLERLALIRSLLEEHVALDALLGGRVGAVEERTS